MARLPHAACMYTMVGRLSDCFSTSRTTAAPSQHRCFSIDAGRGTVAPVEPDAEPLRVIGRVAAGSARPPIYSSDINRTPSSPPQMPQAHPRALSVPSAAELQGCSRNKSQPPDAGRPGNTRSLMTPCSPLPFQLSCQARSARE